MIQNVFDNSYFQTCQWPENVELLFFLVFAYKVSAKTDSVLIT